MDVFVAGVSVVKLINIFRVATRGKVRSVGTCDLFLKLFQWDITVNEC